jgi:predicted outer membrane repeat protein
MIPFLAVACAADEEDAVLAEGALFSGVVRDPKQDCAAPLRVNTQLDEVDARGCTLRHCSLREAVQLSNTCTGQQQVLVPQGLYRMTYENGGRHPVFITDSIAIRGADGARPTISGEGAPLFAVNLPIGQGTASRATFGELVLSGARSDRDGAAIRGGADELMIQNCIIERNSAGTHGGALFVSGNVTLQDSEVRYNSAAQQGGGVRSFGTYTRLSLINTSIAGNQAADGGGVYAEGSLYLLNSVVAHNQATDRGGGLHYFAGSNALILSSSVTRNTAKRGGGLALNNGEASVLASTFNRNRAEDGGAFYASTGSRLLVERALVAHNQATDEGGGLYAEVGTGSSINITGSSFRDNSAFTSAGAIWYGAQQMSVYRSSFVRNYAGVAGAVFVRQSTSRFFNCTFAGNRSGEGGGSAIQIEIGGADLKNSTLVNDTSPNPLLWALGGVANFSLAHTVLVGPSGTPNCESGGEELRPVSRGYNLDSGASCLRATTPTDRVEQTIALAPLGAYGGPSVGDDTSAEPLLLRPTLPGSVARDTGASTTTTSDDVRTPGCLNKDAREVTRPRGPACDLGAVEGD